MMDTNKDQAVSLTEFFAIMEKIGVRAFAVVAR